MPLIIRHTRKSRTQRKIRNNFFERKVMSMALDRTKKLQVLACCGCGNGTCQILAMRIKGVLEKMGIKAAVEPAPASVGQSQWRNYDVIACNLALVSSFKEAAKHGKTVLGLRNVLSESEIEEKFKELF